MPYFSSVAVGETTVTLYPSGHDTAIWENRVSSYVIQNDRRDISVFLAVDALVSEEYAAELQRGEAPSPNLVIVSNNSQIVPYGGFGAQTNLLRLPDDTLQKFTGLSLMFAILVEYLRGIPDVKNVALCGNGFVNALKPYGPFLFSNNKDLAASVNNLSIDERVFGPDPGDILNLWPDGTIETSSADYVYLDENQNAEFYAKRQYFMTNSIPQDLLRITAREPDEEDGVMLKLVKEELDRMGPALLLSPTGKRLMEQHVYLGGPLGSRRAVIRLLGSSAAWHLTFDVASCSFELIDIDAEGALRQFPMGIEAHLADFYGVLTGRLQIWDLAGTGMRSWYLGTKYDNLVAFMFAALGEQSRPDLALEVYRRALKRIDAP